MQHKPWPRPPGREAVALALVSIAFSLSLLGWVLALFAGVAGSGEVALAQARPASAASGVSAGRLAAPG